MDGPGLDDVAAEGELPDWSWSLDPFPIIHLLEEASLRPPVLSETRPVRERASLADPLLLNMQNCVNFFRELTAPIMTQLCPGYFLEEGAKSVQPACRPRNRTGYKSVVSTVTYFCNSNKKHYIFTDRFGDEPN